jgi:hypothetical protein
MDNLIQEIEAKGFAVWNTGGNCRCLIRQNTDNTTDVITAAEGADLPTRDSWLLVKYLGDWTTDADAKEIDYISSGDDSPVDLLTAIDL